MKLCSVILLVGVQHLSLDITCLVLHYFNYNSSVFEVEFSLIFSVSCNYSSPGTENIAAAHTTRFAAANLVGKQNHVVG